MLGCLQGTWTPLHADVLRSYSWSVNVAGSKRWLLLPPRHTHLLFDRFGRHMAPSFDMPPGCGACGIEANPVGKFGIDQQHNCCRADSRLTSWSILHCGHARGRSASHPPRTMGSVAVVRATGCCRLLSSAVQYRQPFGSLSQQFYMPSAEEQYPNLVEARRHIIEVRQGAGDALFVPSGWHHTVENTAGDNKRLVCISLFATRPELAAMRGLRASACT